MSGFRLMAGKELRELVRTRRLAVVVIVFAPRRETTRNVRVAGEVRVVMRFVSYPRGCSSTRFVRGHSTMRYGFALSNDGGRNSWKFLPPLGTRA